MANQPDQTPPLSDEELQSIALLNVGYASEVRNFSSYKLGLAWQKVTESNIGKDTTHEVGDWRPIGNSGYSLGSLQSDFGQRAYLVDDLVSKYETWAGTNPDRLVSEDADLAATLKMNGRTLDSNRTDYTERPISTADTTKFNTFLKSDEGRQTVWEMDQKQINEKLLPFADKIMATSMFDALTDETEKIEVLSVSMKLFNQAEGKANSLLKKIEDGKLTSFSDIETELTSTNNASYIRSGFNHTKEGADLFNKVTKSDTLLEDWLVAQTSTDLSLLTELEYKDDLRYQVLNRLFRNPDKGSEFVDNLEQGEPMLIAVPRTLQDGSAKIIGIDKNGDLFSADQDGTNLSQYIDGSWQQKDGGDPVIKQNGSGRWILALGKNEIDFGATTTRLAMNQQEDGDATAIKASAEDTDPVYAARLLSAERELLEQDPKAFRTAVFFETVETVLRNKGELSAISSQEIDKITAEHVQRLNESEISPFSSQLEEYMVAEDPQQSKTEDINFNPTDLGKLMEVAQLLPEQSRQEMNKKIADFLTEKGFSIADISNSQSEFEPTNDI